jgi:hypothetical protein
VLLEAGNFPQEGPDSSSRKVGPSGGQAIATEALVTTTIARYKPLYVKAKAAYEAKLWNGKYFNYDSSGSYQVTKHGKAKISSIYKKKGRSGGEVIYKHV